MNNKDFQLKNKTKYNTRSGTKWIASHITKYPIITFVFLSVLFFSVFYQNRASIYLGKIFDSIKANSGQDIIKLIVLFFIVSIGQGLLQLASTYSILNLRLKVEKDVRQEIYENLLSKSQTFHDSVKTGDVMALATNETRNISIMFQPGIIMTLRSILSYIIPLGFIAVNFNYILLLNPILFTILSMLLLYFYSKNINNVTKDIRQKFGKLNADLNEAIDGIEVIKSNTQEENEIQKFNKNTGSILKLSLKKAMVEATYIPTLVFAVFFGIALYQALTMFIGGQLTLGQLIAYITIYSNLKFPIANAEITFSFIGLGVASAGRIIEMLRTSTNCEDNLSISEQDLVGAIEFKNVSFGYQEDNLVLKDVSFSVNPGETVAIVGGTGSGKSTIAKLVNRTYNPGAGQVLIDGIDIKEWNLNSLRSRIGIIEQDIFLFSWNIRKNIAFGNNEVEECTSETVMKYAKEAYAHNFIMDFPAKYETLVGERGMQLSGGQRQRIAIARALLSNPKILVLDDSTSAVDSETEDEIQKGIRGMMKGRTTLLITHRLSQIRWADKILMVKKGSVLAQGNHEYLMENCKEYRDMYAGYL